MPWIAIQSMPAKGSTRAINKAIFNGVQNSPIHTPKGEHFGSNGALEASRSAVPAPLGKSVGTLK